MEPVEETLIALLTDVNHWVFEALSEAVFFVVEYVIIRKMIAAYDKAKHKHKHD